MVRCNEICARDAQTLCVADDTAAWVCGRIALSNFVTLRLHAKRYRHLHGCVGVLQNYKFSQSSEQYAMGHHWPVLTYVLAPFASDAPAIQLIIWRGEEPLWRSNPCSQLSYLLHVKQNDDDKDMDNKDKNIVDNDKNIEENSNVFIYQDTKKSFRVSVQTRDCDCYRVKQKNNKNCDLLSLEFEKQYDRSNWYHTFLYEQTVDLLKEACDSRAIALHCCCDNDDNDDDNGSESKSTPIEV
ncbi:lef12 [Lambdina fiscellaria nucleopolyhedrovirus]|uniref:Lef12 n=1 Tax=Lambdina fiscellaria nucleopolyhedrovirus TaxID=1642929 RepID=A0A0E3Z6T4_9ABAC|nr:lef12 [Lambdina fiscellaria nucleopolyhedrovirus]AKC91722.1 lef12 [Lambdina fiscellaria nucleopolyhedrovirus]